MLIHIIDISGFDGSDPYDNYKTINRELKIFKIPIKKSIIIVLNKTDLPDSDKNIKNSRKLKNKKIIEISPLQEKALILCLKDRKNA